MRGRRNVHLREREKDAEKKEEGRKERRRQKSSSIECGTLIAEGSFANVGSTQLSPANEGRWHRAVDLVYLTRRY